MGHCKDSEAASLEWPGNRKANPTFKQEPALSEYIAFGGNKIVMSPVL